MSIHTQMRYFLRECYKDSPENALFIEKDFSLLYANDTVIKNFPYLCGEESVKPFLKKSSVEELEKNEEAKVVELFTGGNFHISVFYAEPTYDFGEIGYYKIYCTAFGDPEIKCPDASGLIASKNVSSEMVKSFEALSENFDRVKSTVTLHDFSVCSLFSDDLCDLVKQSTYLNDFLMQTSRFSGAEKSCFRLSVVLSEYERLLPFPVLPDGFVKEDDTTAVFNSKGGIAEALVFATRFLLNKDFEKSIFTDVYLSGDNVVIQLSAFYFGKIRYKGIGFSFARKITENLGGKLYYIRKYSLLTLFFIFPALGEKPLSGVWEETTTGFEELEDEIKELLNEKRNKSKN